MLPSTARATRAEVMAPDLEKVTATAPANLIYKAADPWAVELTVRTAAGWVSWVFARSLLADAVLADGSTFDQIGQGDVRISAPGAHVLLELNSPTGHAVLRLPRADVERLLDKAEQLVPEGDEVLDWDREITLLVGEGA
ncbi:SsgA family sporulation/cell division regulator [Amycolatopsis sp. NPDC058340]|uniref:SsgA family sporulation/cell division regulator n=1 Tax=Amycolatopsis sp. NPDC058340 TaxID=3346453 RepID=UPI003650157B